MLDVDIQKVRKGDSSEIKKLVYLVTEAVHAVVLSYVRNQQDAEEIIQDTILRAIQEIDSFKESSSLKTWVYRIAINRSKDVLKYKSRQKRASNIVSIDDDNAQHGLLLRVGNYYSPGGELESKEYMDMLFVGISLLPDKQRQALTLTKLEGLPMKEVARIMDTTAKSVEGLVARSKLALRSFLDKQEP